jgi:hypothetical protein
VIALLAVFAECSTLSQSCAAKELVVHLAQANNDSPYAFVRAKFEPGELNDPWAVRFFDDAGKEIPYFLWDSLTWKVAREGRADWGGRYAQLNHAAGDTPEVAAARGEKIAWAKEHMTALGAKLVAQDEAAKKAGESVCSAMYLLKCRVPALGKRRVALRTFDQPQVKAERRTWQGREVSEQVSVSQGDLKFAGLPDRLAVSWKGQELFRCGGFDAGGAADAVSHADPARPFTIEATEGLVTRLAITGHTKWRQDASMDWQCTYWLFPEGGYVALEGFSLSDPGTYLGGHQKLSLFSAPAGAEFSVGHAPNWDQPWWLHKIGERGFIATHQFFATPLTVGYGNNPFTVNAEGQNKEPRVDLENGQLALRWFHQVNDSAIARLMWPQSIGLENGHIALIGDKSALAWKPKTDWLYRQYVLGSGKSAEAAEGTLRSVLGAAAGWIDRPFGEEEIATLLVSLMDEIGRGGQSSEIGLLKVVSAVLADDPAAIQSALRDRFQNHPERTDFYIDLMKKNVALGGKPASGGGQQPDGTRREGWTGNPCYHAALMPCSIRTMEHFDLKFPRDAHHQAVLRYADFGLELLGGTPVDFDRFRTELEAEWPSRTVPTIPLMLHAYTLKPDERYARVAKMLFDDHLRLVERNPHGYFPAWSYTPQADKFDTVYNPVAYERGLTAFWSDQQLHLIGRERAAQFVTAQARWFAFSGQIADTLEVDNVTAIRACNHGGHTGLRNQIGIYLFDDFAFYRGLVGELISWSAATRPATSRLPSAGTGPFRKLELSNAGSSMVRWALDIRPGSRWLESNVQKLEPTGFQMRIWQRLPKSSPVVTVRSDEIGLPAGSDVLEARPSGPAFREPLLIEAKPVGRSLAISANKPVKLRLYHRQLQPAIAEGAKLALVQQQPGGTWRELSAGVTWMPTYVEWTAETGNYEIR